MASNNYTDRLCRYFELNGFCKYMENCKFRHNNKIGLTFESNSKSLEEIADNKDTHEEYKGTHEEYKGTHEECKDTHDDCKDLHHLPTDFKDFQENQQENLKNKKNSFKENHKEKLCRYFNSGNCRSGEMCKFAHIIKEFAHIMNESKKNSKNKKHSANAKNDYNIRRDDSHITKNDCNNRNEDSCITKNDYDNRNEDSRITKNDYNNKRDDSHITKNDYDNRNKGSRITENNYDNRNRGSRITKNDYNNKRDDSCITKNDYDNRNEDSHITKKDYNNRNEDSGITKNDCDNTREDVGYSTKDSRNINTKKDKYSQNVSIIVKNNSVKKLQNCKHFMSKNGCKHGNKCLFKHYRSTSDAADDISKHSINNAADRPQYHSNNNAAYRQQYHSINNAADRQPYHSSNNAADRPQYHSNNNAADRPQYHSNNNNAADRQQYHSSNNAADRQQNHSNNNAAAHKPFKYSTTDADDEILNPTEYKVDFGGLYPPIEIQERSNIVDFSNDYVLFSSGMSKVPSNSKIFKPSIDNILVPNDNTSNPNIISKYENFKPYDEVKDNKLKRCRFFFSSSGCRRKDLCKFLHVNFEENSETLERNSKDILEDKKCSDNYFQPTGNMKSFENLIDFEKLRSTELVQLEKRFKNNLKSKHESSDMYTVTIEPSDPDWPYVVKAFTLSFSFPKDYPQELFKVCLENKEGLYPDGFTEFMNEFLQEWLEKRSNDRSETDLAFRPFIRWFDRNLETLFTSSATKVKRQQDAIRAGVTFIPHSKILGSSNVFKIANLTSEATEKNDDDIALEDNDNIENDIQNNEFEIIESKPSQVKKGTEVKFPKMSIINIGTLKLTDLALTIHCDRCKLKTDVKLKDQVSFVTSCSKCKTVHSVAFYSELMHQSSNVAGYLHLYGCKPFDLILSDSTVTINCFKCIRDNFLQGISYGSPRHHWCTFCHEKMEVEIPAVQFNILQPAVTSVLDAKPKAPPKLKVLRDPGMKDGEPLPENGACKHYKKSYRWFRFPCCGKVFPCDKCHEESSNDGHEMLLATKMLCGFCAKEQPFSKDKPCIRCGSNTIRSRSSHWEGGKGCRDVLKMARGDKRKTAGLGKTIPRKHDLPKSK